MGRFKGKPDGETHFFHQRKQGAVGYMDWFRESHEQIRLTLFMTIFSQPMGAPL